MSNPKTRDVTFVKKKVEKKNKTFLFRYFRKINISEFIFNSTVFCIFSKFMVKLSSLSVVYPTRVSV